MIIVSPPTKICIHEPELDKNVELLKCLPLENVFEKDGKKHQRFRFLACFVVADGKGSIGSGETKMVIREFWRNRELERVVKKYRGRKRWKEKAET